MSNDELVELYFEDVAVDETSGGARGFTNPDDGRIVYIPITLIKDSETVDGCVTIKVPVWFAEKEGLV